MEFVKDLDIVELKQAGQQLNMAQQDPVPVAAAQNNAPDNEENKSQPH